MFAQGFDGAHKISAPSVELGIVSKKQQRSIVSTEYLHSKGGRFWWEDGPTLSGQGWSEAKAEFHLDAKDKLLGAEAFQVFGSENQLSGLMAILDLNQNRRQMVSLDGLVDAASINRQK